MEVSNKRKKTSKFDKVGNAKSTNLSRKQKRVYLLTDLLVCGGCESLFTGNHQNKRTSQYRCRSVWRRYRNTDPNYVDCKYKRTLRMDLTDDLVWNNVIDVLEKSNLYREKVKQSLLPSNELMKEKKENVERNNKRIRKLKIELDKIEDAITKQQTTRLLVENTKQIDGVIKELDKRRIETLSGIETLTEENQTNVKVDEWIDWYKSFGDKINDLRKANLSIEEKNQFITGVVKSIEVIEKSWTEHELRIEYREPFVGDKLVWNNVKKKSLGYKLKNGRKKMTLNGVLTSKT